ncbi:PREDICTED: transcriptional regulator ATRX homolog [Eufriesea mexicana]|uniref:transcriptional regulator ATRX homolog n=1 Tax=Eufriesea mexicana TaxID=516756 RepID=UPI00083C2113|nr:PREDICTED: transcriptional regulator ATRX homolog [Eufriesea mexicana]
MSTCKRGSKKRYSHQASEINEENTSIHLKHRLAKIKKLQKSIRSLCDNDDSSPEDIRPFFLKSVNSRDNSLDKSSDEGTIDKSIQKKRSVSSKESENDYDKQKKTEEHLKTDKHKNNMKSKKIDYDDLRKKKNRSRNSDFSDSENEIYEKFTKKTDRRHLASKSKQKDFMNFYKEDADSSSGKEFQKSNIFHSGLKIMKKLSQVKQNSETIEESNSDSTTQLGKKIIINKEQSLQFKSNFVKIFNKFKEVCSEYELQMEHVKSKYFKRELIYQESANNIIKKSKNVINSLRKELEAQEKELTNFYKKWNTNHELQSTDHENNSLSENEMIKETENKEKSDKSRNSSNAASIVSECDNEEIFSDNETTIAKTNIDKNKKDEDLIVAKISGKTTSDSENSHQSNSPILGTNKRKGISNKTCKDNLEVTNKNEKSSEECQISINEHSINESKDIIENNDNTDENSLRNDELNTQFKDNDSYLIEVGKPKSIVSEEISELIEKEENSVSDELEDEEQAKKAMLESDSEVPTNEESLIKKSIKKSKINDNSDEKNALRLEEIQLDKKENKNKTESNSLHENNSSEQDEITKVEACAKRNLLESNSDDSMSPCDIKKSLNKKHDSSDNSENSSSDNDSKLNAIRTGISSKQKKGKSQSFAKAKMELNSEQPTHLTKINYDESDKKLKMFSQVVIERLPEKILKKHKKALEKSQQYLENKKLKSLIDLDRLQRNCSSTNDSSRSPLFRKVKKSKVKEVEDSLLDHLKNVEDGKFLENTEEESNMENDASNPKTQACIQTNEELIIEADAATKKVLLCSSDSDIGEQKVASENNDSEEEENKIKLKDNSQKTSKKVEKKDSDKENDEELKKNKWRRNKLLTMKLSSDSDTDSAREKWDKKQKELAEKTEATHTENSAVKDEIVKRKRRNPRKIMDSDSDVQFLNSDTESNNSVILEDNKSSGSDSSIGKSKKVRKRKTHKSSDTDSSVTEKRSKPKRRRIKNMPSDSDENSDSDQITNSQGTPGKKGRKNIRKVMKDKQVTDDTKQAAKEEEERLKRIAERQKLYNEMYEARLAGEEKLDKLVLDFNPETKEELVIVHKNLVVRLKPHQAKGIKFMWDACFESLERIKSSTGSGCIIAHCMGLGKTLQVIALVHTLLTNEKTGVKTVMVVCPLSTVLNWLNEFNLWLKNIENNDIEVYEMTKLKKNIERKFQLESWQRTGGVLLIGYEMFRNLTGTNNRMRKNMKEAILRYLIDPGPDMIVCDEGHLLKNEDTALSKSINRIKTLRRIVLTGTPLQNNLTEYHCMVQFVKPNLLGTKKEFLNRFVNPITNGQFDDSTEYDVKLMKKRAYVLHKMLKGCVQRFDYSVLTPFLPPKQEYVIFVSLTKVQVNLYQHYLDNFARRTRSASGSLFADFQALQRIWTHPIVLQLNAEKIEKMNEKRLDSSDSEGSLKDFIDDSETDSTTSETSSNSDDQLQNINSNVIGKNTRSNPKNIKPEVEIVSKSEESEKKEEEWWAQFIQSENLKDMKVSSKLILLFGILKECEQIGDKVLVFSQSLYSLTLIEQFLEKIDNETQNGTNSEYIDGHTGSWSFGLDYFRLDGQTSPENRNTWCKIFNEPSNTRARLFLISTRAGGLGINLTAANRVIIFDASWNPSHDMQSIFRVYRFGQKKPCYVYRFLAAGTMEEKIYNRQVTKLSLSCRVVDEQQIERHYSNHDLSELYTFEPNINNGEKPTLNLPKDRLLAEIFLKYKNCVENYHEHDSLLENKAEEELNEEERKQAWLEYEEEKKGKPPQIPLYPSMATFPNHVMLNQYNIPSTFNISTDFEKLKELLRKDYPNATPETQQMMTTRVLTDMYSYWEQQAYHNSTNRIIDQNPSMNAIQMRTQLPNLARMPYVVQSTSKNLINQPKDYRTPDIRSEDHDDDVVEVTSTTVNNKNKNQEE